MLIGGLDVGTTGTKLTVYDVCGCFVGNEYVEYDVSRKNGEDEIDVDVIFSAVCDVISKTVKKHSDLAAIGVTTFGETFTVLDENNKPLFPSMLYTDPRGEEETRLLCNTIGNKKLRQITGVNPHQMYSIPKMMWLKNKYPEEFSKAKRILLMGDYIVYMLTGNARIDYSLAARTMAFDIVEKRWSAEILNCAGIDESLLSMPVPTGTLAGSILKDLANKLGAPDNLKIVTGCHDQIAAAVGAGVFESGQAVDGTGTVECVTPVFDGIPDNEGIYDGGYSVVPYVFENKYVCYALSYAGGATLKWYRDCFAKYEKQLADETGENVYALLDKQVSSAPTDLLVLPHFAGAATPYMDVNSKGAIIGLTFEHTSADIYKAMMEGATYEIMMNTEHLSNFGIKIDELYATGGGASSPIWLQIKADILNRPITTLESREVGACGICMLTAVAIGAIENLTEAKKMFVKQDKTYTPNAANISTYHKNFEAYKMIYDAVRPVISKTMEE